MPGTTWRCAASCVVWLAGQALLAWCGAALACAMYDYSQHAASTASSVRSSQPWACGECVTNEPRFSCVLCSLGRHSAQLSAKSRAVELAAQRLAGWLPVEAAHLPAVRSALVKAVHLAVAWNDWSLVSGVVLTSLWLSKLWACWWLLPAVHRWLDARDAATSAERRRKSSEMLAHRAAHALAPQPPPQPYPDASDQLREVDLSEPPGTMRRRMMV